MNGNTIISIENISVKYGARTVLSDFSLTLNRGDKIIISGPNGSGKTTLLKTILGIITPQSGRVTKDRKMRTAYLRQGFPEPLAPVSVRETVSMGLYRSRGREKTAVEDAMKATGVEELSSRSFSSLSGGEKERVEIAQCLVRNADLVLMDEPTSFLDTASRDETAQIISSLPSSMAVVIVTHDEVFTRFLGWPVIRLGKEETCKE